MLGVGSMGQIILALRNGRSYGLELSRPLDGWLAMTLSYPTTRGRVERTKSYGSMLAMGPASLMRGVIILWVHLLQQWA